MQLHHLKALSEVRKDTPHSRWCCVVSDAWYTALHSPKASEESSDVRMRHAQAALEDMLSPEAVPGTEALKYVLELSNPNPSTTFMEFPGPMCTPFCKKDVSRLCSHAYTVTEKSDGIRVVVAAVWTPLFPCWDVDISTQGDVEVASPLGQRAHLADVLALERAREAQLRVTDEAVASALGVPVLLQGQHFVLQATFNCSDAGTELFTLVSKDEKDGSPPLSWTLSRCLRGRHLAYALDRSLDALYLFLDDHTTPAYHTFVLDAELMCVHGSALPSTSATHLVLGAFDLYSYVNATDAVVVNLAKQTMMERYEALNAVVRTCATTTSGTSLGFVPWYAKEMWALSEVGACLAKLQYNAASNCFLFKGPYGTTENDGLIFTPNDFPIASGSSNVQLKWKWRHLLSIDWLLQASDKQPDVYTVFLFFLKKNYGHRDDISGHWRLRKPMNILNPHGYEMPVDRAVVGECAYNAERQQWYIQRLRPDKRGANSIVTAISVYESLVENISLVRLLELLHIDGEESKQLAIELEQAVSLGLSSFAEATEPTSFDVAEGERCLTAKVTLRAVRESRGDTELFLNAYTNQTNKAVKYPLPFPLRKIRECAGLGYDPPKDGDLSVSSGATLEEALYVALANAGGCYAWSDYVVDVFYSDDTGYWEIIHVNPRGNNKEAVFDNVIEHLDWRLRNRAAGAEIAALLQRRRDAPLVIARPPTCDATKETSRHYGKVGKELANAERSDLRRFNNWVKTALLQSAVEAVRSKLKDSTKIHALDLCCGRGGDLLKWQHLHPAFLFMTDASVECVAEAAARYSTSEGQSLKSSNGKQRGFPAFFAVYDAFDRDSELHLTLRKRGPFQIASCQFSMHYGCRSEESLLYFVKSVADALVVHGRFVGTTVSDVELVRRAKEYGISFGNEVYHISFETEAFTLLQDADFDPAKLFFGIPYAATVERSVQGMTEYVVPWNAFVALCAKHRLKLLMEDNFLHFFEQNRNAEAGKAVLQELQRKRNSEGGPAGIPLTPEEQKAVGLYRLFVFEKI